MKYTGENASGVPVKALWKQQLSLGLFRVRNAENVPDVNAKTLFFC